MRRIATLAVAAIGLTQLAGCTVSTLSIPPGQSADNFKACLKSKPGLNDPNSDDGSQVLPTAYGRLVASLQIGTGIIYERRSAIERGGTSADKPQYYQASYDALTAAKAAELEATPLQEYLDCFIGPVDPLDYQTRLLRGHILVTILAEWIDFTLQKTGSEERAAFAQQALVFIAEAEAGLRSASANLAAEAAKTEGTMISPSRHFLNVQRVEKILALSALGAKVEIRALKGWVAQVLTALANPDVTQSVSDIANLAVTGLQRAATRAQYESAFFQDSYESVIRMYPATPSSQVDTTVVQRIRELATANTGARKGAWEAWDVRLNATCESLASAARQKENQCTSTPLVNTPSDKAKQRAAGQD